MAEVKWKQATGFEDFSHTGERDMGYEVDFTANDYTGTPFTATNWAVLETILPGIPPYVVQTDYAAGVMYTYLDTQSDLYAFLHRYMAEYFAMEP